MYNKIDIVFKIGTILSFFVLGINYVSFFDYDIEISKILIFVLPDHMLPFFKFMIDKKIHLSYVKNALFLIAFGGITWSLIYCFKAFKSAHIDLLFQNNKGMFKWIFCNNSNHTIKIKQIILSSKKDNDGDILDCYWFIPSNEVLSPYIQMNKKIIPKDIMIIYSFNDSDPNYVIKKELTKKEIKMFEKLSLSQK